MDFNEIFKIELKKSQEVLLSLY